MPANSLNRFRSLLAAKRPILADGAMGTTLFAAGLDSGEAPERWNLDHPDRVLAVHRAYVDAGSDLVLTNTFGANSFRLHLHGLQDRAAEINRRAGELARTAADSAGRLVAVAGSMGPTGELLEPMGSMDPAACTASFAEQAAGLVEGGVDVLWLETMSDLGEVDAAIAGIRQVTATPIAVCMSFDTAGRTMMGVGAESMARHLADRGVEALGANCGNNLADTEAAVGAMVAAGVGLPVISKANAGIPQWQDGALVYSGTPEVMGAHAHRAAAAGATIIGGCCGSSADHIAFMRGVLDGTTPIPDIEPARPTDVADRRPRTRRRARR